jgi:hypothetical protein
MVLHVIRVEIIGVRIWPGYVGGGAEVTTQSHGRAKS